MSIYKIKRSKIHGVDIFTQNPIKKGQMIGVIVEYIHFVPTITKFGSYINHSYDPNSALYYNKKNNTWILIAIKNINKDEEITANYNHSPDFIDKAEPYYK